MKGKREKKEDGRHTKCSLPIQRPGHIPAANRLSPEARLTMWLLAGLLARFQPNAFPSLEESGLLLGGGVATKTIPETYSSGDCPGFAPVFPFHSVRQAGPKPKTATKIVNPTQAGAVPVEYAAGCGRRETPADWPVCTARSRHALSSQRPC